MTISKITKKNFSIFLKTGVQIIDGDRIMADDSLYDDALDAFDEYDIEYEEV